MIASRRWPLASLACLLLCACGGTDSRPATPVALQYRVEGMHCDGCVQAITDKLKHVDGVVDCRVSLQEKRADVSVRDRAMAPTVQRAIEKQIGRAHV